MIRSLTMALCALLLAFAFLAVTVGPALYRAWPALVALHQGVR